MEGGDELVLNAHTLAIGVSQRTSSRAIQALAEELFTNTDSHFDTIIAVEIPHNHAMMHLDTVFTMVNYDQFTVFPGIMDDEGKMNINILRATSNGKISMAHRDNLKKTLKEVLNLDDIDLIETGDADPIISPREQWNDGSNNLTITPGEVVTYDRNYVSIKLMREHGIKVDEIKSSELARGRGGGRCMSQPIWRENI